MKQTDENKLKAGEAGGIDAVAKAINAHLGNADVCYHGCSALWNMVLNGKKKGNNEQMHLDQTNEQMRMKKRLELKEELRLL